MNTLKTLCMAVVLAAAGYGAYVTLTGHADVAPPMEVTDLTTSPPVVSGDLLDNRPFGNGPATSIDGARRVVPVATSPTVTITPPTPELPPIASPPSFSSANSLGSNGPAGGPAMMDSMPPSAAPFSTTAPPGMTPPPTSSSLAGAGPGMSETTAGAPPTGDVRSEFMASWDEAQRLLAAGQMKEALLALSEWVTDTRLSAADHDRLMDLLDQLGGTVIYSRQHLLEPPYVVQPGETLETIAAKYEIPWQLLGKINGVGDPLQVRPGDQLKVVRGPFDALVELNSYQLTLFVHSRYAGRFRIGIGQDQPLPEQEQTFTVQQKVVNPPYFGAAGETLAPNDPNNPLGGRWVDLGQRFGIHGTNDPASVGRTGARGCIRLTPSDILDVYDILSVGSNVTIRR